MRVVIDQAGLLESQPRRRRTTCRLLFSHRYFLAGLIHIGEKKIPAGRVGEPPAHGISQQLRSAGLQLGRLKTGTPARLDGRTINWSVLEEQKGDEVPTPFSTLTDSITTPQVSCFITQTTARTHELIANNIHRSRGIPGRSKERAAHCPPLRTRSTLQGQGIATNISGAEGLDDDTVYQRHLTRCRRWFRSSYRTMSGLEKSRSCGWDMHWYDDVDPVNDRGWSHTSPAVSAGRSRYDRI